MKNFMILLVLFFILPAICARAESLILFEEGHGQIFHAGNDGDLDLSLLAGKAREAGCRVESIDRLDTTSLAGADALVISGPFQPFTPAEIAAVLAFLDHGGRLALMLHIGPPVASLMTPLGIYHSNGVVRENATALQEQPLNFYVRDLTDHPLFSGIAHFAIFGAWALDTEGKSTIIARSDAKAWIDLDRDGQQTTKDAVAAFGLAAAGNRGKGQFVIFGDDAIFQNRYLREYNDALGDRLANWLAGKI